MLHLRHSLYCGQSSLLGKGWNTVKPEAEACFHVGQRNLGRMWAEKSRMWAERDVTVEISHMPTAVVKIHFLLTHGNLKSGNKQIKRDAQVHPNDVQTSKFDYKMQNCSL